MPSSLKELNLEEDVATASVNNVTSYQITALSASQNLNVVAFVAESTSTGMLSNAQGAVTITPLSSAFRHIANYYFSSTAGNTIPVAQDTNSSSSILRVIQVGRTTMDDALVTGSITAVFGFNTSGNNTFIDVPQNTVTASVGRKGSLVAQSNTSNIAGTVFYDSGTMIFHGGTGITNFLITSTSGFSFGVGTTAGTVAITQLSFKSSNIIKRTIFFCTAKSREFNYTNNVSSLSDAVKGTITASLTANPTTYITGIGLLNNDGDLLAVAKVSPPVKKTFSDLRSFGIRIQF